MSKERANCYVLAPEEVEKVLRAHAQPGPMLFGIGGDGDGWGGGGSPWCAVKRSAWI